MGTLSFPLAKPHITDEDISAVVSVLKSGHLSLGPAIVEFEEAFARMAGTRHACAVSSGTAGLHLALIAAGIGPGDEVITSPFSFVASANAILYVGATPVFVDIDPMTYNLDPARIEAATTPRTKAILPVHIFGQACDMGAITALAKKHNLIIIEDACESVLAEYKGRKVGTFGSAAVFAFYPNKQMTTGEGGMIVTDDTDVYDACVSLRNQGRGLNMQWLDHVRLGYNYRMDEMSAALGLSQLRKLDFFIKERQRIAGWYAETLSAHADVVRIPRTALHNNHTWFVYVVQLARHVEKRDEMIRALADEGIGSKPYLPSIHLLSFYQDRYGYKPGDFPAAESVSRSALALPLYIGLTQTDISCIVEKLMSIVRVYDSRISG